jgi:hypothetical protein
MATADLTCPALGGRRVESRTPVERSAGVPDCTARSRGYDAAMRSAARLLAALVVVVGVGACVASPAASSVPVGSPPPSPAAGAEMAATSGVTSNPAIVPSKPAPTPVGTTNTPWGRILDAVPARFPVFPNASAADPPPTGAVSGAWVSASPASQVAAWYHDALLAANWAKVDDGGALEDGSHVIDIVGDRPECKAQLTVKPAGGLTMVTVLYGAGCVGGS